MLGEMRLLRLRSRRKAPLTLLSAKGLAMTHVEDKYIHRI